MKNLLIFTFCLFLLTGCGGGTDASRLPVFKVHGKVTYKGQPVVGADVTFTSETAKKSAFGRTDDAGMYALTTYSGNDGAVDGKQSVLIAKILAPPGVPEASIESPEYVPPGYGPATPDVASKNELPAKYGAAETSGLIAIVNPDPDNEINFDLTD